MTEERAAPACATCGAPDPGDVVLCRYCRQAVSAEAQRTAIPCPRCRLPNRWGRQHCAQCQAWIVVKCVFCAALTPCNQTACLGCSEPFAGAPERKAAREGEVARQRLAEGVSTWGGVAASFLGAAAGVALGESFGEHHHPHHHEVYGGGSTDGYAAPDDGDAGYDDDDAGDDDDADDGSYDAGDDDDGFDPA